MSNRKPRVAINGFGRIGRIFARAAGDRVDIVGINNLSESQSAAHLFKYDSAHGRFNGEVTATEDSITINGQKARYTRSKDPKELPWKDLDVDLVLECTGIFTDKATAGLHIDAGAKKVMVSAPSKDADLTLVYGINHENYDPKNHDIVSNASCTTNCLAPVAKVLNESFGIKNGLMTTIHSYTNDQNILDAFHKDLRRARAGAVSMIPTTTGAAKAVAKVLPELDGKLNGLAVRVPTPNVSLVDLVIETEKEVTAETANAALIEASKSSLKGILACEDAPLVSVDYMGTPESSIVDLQNTMTMGPNLLKVFSWYDNEYGFSTRMVDMAEYMAHRGF